MNRKPRLLFVDNDVNSLLSYRIELARAARDAGFEVHMASPPGRAANVLRKEGFPFHAVSMTRRGVEPWKESRTVFGLFRLYRKLRPDIVHHLRLKPVLYGSLAASFARVPAVVNMLTGLGYVFTGNGTRIALLRTLVKAGCKVAFRHKNQRVIFQNPDDRAVFLDCKILEARQTVLVKGSGVDVSVFTELAEPERPPVVMLASRMLKDKGVCNFVEAARSLRAQGIEASFVLVGDTDPGNPTAIPVEELQAWARSGVVEWWGPQENIRAVLAKCHIVCLPSFREGVPKILIEAAACGRPIVTTDVPGCREIVRHGENGLLVPVRNSAALAGALRLLIGDGGLRERMGQHGRQIAVTEFSLNRVIRETLAVYDELLPARVQELVALTAPGHANQ